MRLLTTAPLRISLMGGGTDVGEYQKRYGGVCLNVAINMRQEFTLDTEDKGFYLPPRANIEFYKAFLKEFRIKTMRIEQNFNGFINGGLGSSASAAVALVAGITRLKGKNLSRYEIAEKSWDVEVNKLRLFGGKQDQFTASFGGFNLMRFNERVEIESIPRGIADNIAKHILLFDTGTRRKNPKLQENLKVITKEQKQALDRIKEIALEAHKLVYRGKIDLLGDLLHESWSEKKRSNKVSSPQIDAIYQKAIDAGAYGGKLVGSGGGGYMIFLAERKDHEKIKKALNLKWVDFSIDYNGVETKIL